MGEVAARTLEIARELIPAHSDDDSLQQILINEIRRRLNRYELVDDRFQRKYGLSFSEFRNRRVVEQQEYGFEVEADFCDWEMAITGIAALHEQLADLGAAGHD